MKRRLFICFISLSCVSFGQYTPLLRQGIAWNIRNHQMGFDPCISYGPLYNGAQFYLDGDSVINSITYQKVYSHPISEGTIPVPQTPCFYYEVNQTVSNFEMLLYEDIGTQRVYVYDEMNDTLGLVLDFSLDVGDTLWRYDMPAVVITGIDSFMVNGDWRKELQTDAGESYWEGIGSANGLVAELYSPVSGILPYVCVWHDGVNEFGGCQLYLNTPEENVQASMKCFQQRIEVSLTSPNQIRIFAYDGRLVYTQSLPQGESVVDVSFLERGAYIIHIGDSFTEKFIKN